MKYLSVLLFIVSLSAGKHIQNYVLELNTDKGGSDWPINAVLKLTSEKPLQSEIKLEKREKNVRNVLCRVLPQDSKANCSYEDDGTLKIIGATNETELLLDYKIEKTQSLKFWNSADNKLKILAGNLGVKSNEVILYEVGGTGQLEIKVNNKTAEILNKDDMRKATFLGGDIETSKKSSVKFYFPKNHFEFARKVLTQFAEGFNNVRGRPFERHLLLIPIDLELGGLQNESALAEALETKKPGKFFKQYSKFVEREIKSSLGNSQSLSWIEALVNYLSYFLMSKQTTDLGFVWLDELFLDVIQNEALEKDAYNSSPPLINDKVLLGKGFALMHSLNRICGNDKFEEGVRNCLKAEIHLDTIEKAFKNCFKNSDEAKIFIHKFVNQSGYPVLFVEETTKDEYKIYQEQFFLSENNGSKNTWMLPVPYKTQNGTGKVWLLEKEVELQASNILSINSQYEGYYRVNYPKNIWDAFIKDENKMDPLFRAQIINDIFSFSKSTKSFSRPVPDYDTALKLIKYLGKETNYAPVKAAFDAFEFLESALVDELNSRFKSFIEPIVKDLYNNIALHNNPEPLMAREVGFWACRLGIESCIKHAEEKLKGLKGSFDIFSSPNSGIDLLEWEVPFCVDIRNGSENWWKILWGKMENMDEGGGNKPEESSLLINILGCTKNDKNLKSLIEMVERKNKGDDDACRGILRGNQENVKTVLKYLIEKKKYPTKFQINMARWALSKMNKDNMHLFAELKEAWRNEEIFNEFQDVTKHRNEWNKKKLSLLRDFLSSGEMKTAPIALIVLFSALLPFLNSVFK